MSWFEFCAFPWVCALVAISFCPLCCLVACASNSLKKFNNNINIRKLNHFIYKALMSWLDFCAFVPLGLLSLLPFRVRQYCVSGWVCYQGSLAAVHLIMEGGHVCNTFISCNNDCKIKSNFRHS